MKLRILWIYLVCCLSAGSAYADGFVLTSGDIAGQLTEKEVYSGFGCSGQNISPQLAWANAPQGTKSFAVTVYDPDAPTGSGWWHWVVFNIPESVHSLAADAGNLEKGLSPKGSVQSVTDYGQPGFGGACLPARGGRLASLHLHDLRPGD